MIMKSSLLATFQGAGAQLLASWRRKQEVYVVFLGHQLPLVE
jgi:hypothetical protein